MAVAAAVTVQSIAYSQLVALMVFANWTAVDQCSAAMAEEVAAAVAAVIEVEAGMSYAMPAMIVSLINRLAMNLLRLSLTSESNW